MNCLVQDRFARGVLLARRFLQKLFIFTLNDHHEKYDGTGYPKGVKGEDIPLISRIIAVADVYEAITADRVYRPAMNLEQALYVMLQGKGTYFNPVILEALFSIVLKSEPGAQEIISKYRQSKGWPGAGAQFK